jgi:hypothetical protein
MSVIEFHNPGHAAIGAPAIRPGNPNLDAYDHSLELHMTMEDGKNFYLSRLNKFRSDKDAVAAAAAFEAGVLTGQTFKDVMDHMRGPDVVNENGETVPGPDVLRDDGYTFTQNNPPFTFLSEKNIVVPLFYDTVTDHEGGVWGFKGLINAQSAFPGAYQTPKKSEAASGSLFHILIIPSDYTSPHGVRYDSFLGVLCFMCAKVDINGVSLVGEDKPSHLQCGDAHVEARADAARDAPTRHSVRA